MKAKLRRLIIDHVEYHWAYTTHILRPAMQTVISLRAWGHHKSHRMLKATFLIPSVGWIFLLPGEARTIIDAGLAQGWQPLQHGAPLALQPFSGLKLACSEQFQIVNDRAVNNHSGAPQ